MLLSPTGSTDWGRTPVSSVVQVLLPEDSDLAICVSHLSLNQSGSPRCFCTSYSSWWGAYQVLASIGTEQVPSAWLRERDRIYFCSIQPLVLRCLFTCLFAIKALCVLTPTSVSSFPETTWHWSYCCLPLEVISTTISHQMRQKSLRTPSKFLQYTIVLYNHVSVKSVKPTASFYCFKQTFVQLVKSLAAESSPRPSTEQNNNQSHSFVKLFIVTYPVPSRLTVFLGFKLG